MLQGKTNQRTLCTILTAILFVLSLNVVGANGTDPLDPSDGGLIGTVMDLQMPKNKTKAQIIITPDSDGDGLPDG